MIHADEVKQSLNFDEILAFFEFLQRASTLRGKSDCDIASQHRRALWVLQLLDVARARDAWEKIRQPARAGMGAAQRRGALYNRIKAIYTDVHRLYNGTCIL